MTVDILPPTEAVLLCTHPSWGVHVGCANTDTWNGLCQAEGKTATCCCFNLHFSDCHLSSTIFRILFFFLPCTFWSFLFLLKTAYTFFFVYYFYILTYKGFFAIYERHNPWTNLYTGNFFCFQSPTLLK